MVNKFKLLVFGTPMIACVYTTAVDHCLWTNAVSLVDISQNASATIDHRPSTVDYGQGTPTTFSQIRLKETALSCRPSTEYYGLFYF